MRRGALVMAVAALAVVSCSKPPPKDRVSALAEAVSEAPIGPSRDYWLLRRPAGGRADERVVFVFGFADDKAVCEGMAALYGEQAPDDRYACVPAN